MHVHGGTGTTLHSMLCIYNCRPEVGNYRDFCLFPFDDLFILKLYYSNFSGRTSFQKRAGSRPPYTGSS